MATHIKIVPFLLPYFLIPHVKLEQVFPTYDNLDKNTTSKACVLCKGFLFKHTCYASAHKERLKKYVHIRSDIGHTLENLKYFCHKCQTASSKRWKVDEN